MIVPFYAFENYAFENILKKQAFAPLEQMLHIPYYFQNYSKLNLNFSCCLKIENDVMI